MEGQAAHKNCREGYTNKKDIALHLKRKKKQIEHPRKRKRKV